nr:copia protein [Tanacetum cinerariifolium]
NAPSFVLPPEQVKTPRSSIKPVETSILAANQNTKFPKPKGHGNNRNRKACFVCKSLTNLIKDCDYYEKKMAQTPAKNNAQRGTLAGPITTAVPKPHVTRPGPAKTVVTKDHSPPRRHINRSPSPKASTFPPKVTAAKAPMVNAVQGKWEWKPKCPILDHDSQHLSASMTLKSSAQTKMHDDKTKREAKGKSPIESSTGYRNLYAEFEDFFDNNINEVNAAGTSVPAIGQISNNNTNTFSAASPSNTVEDVGVEADFTNWTHSGGGTDYEEVFAPVARIEAIRLFLAYASFMGFMLYQMDVKSAFMYGTIKEEVYVCQPLGFEDPDYPDKVYKVRGKIDQTLFIKKKKGDILLVQVYVDDIIFGSTNKDLCKAFEKLMKDKFQMSSMGEHTIFMDLRVKQKRDGIFIS